MKITDQFYWKNNNLDRDKTNKVRRRPNVPVEYVL
jgi:hypothetical protein